MVYKNTQLVHFEDAMVIVEWSNERTSVIAGDGGRMAGDGMPGIY